MPGKGTTKFYHRHYVQSSPSGCPATAAYNLPFMMYYFCAVAFDMKFWMCRHLNLVRPFSFISTIVACQW